MMSSKYLINGLGSRIKSYSGQGSVSINFFREKSSKSSFGISNQGEVQDPGLHLYKDVVPKIGLEIHAQLTINSKLFSQGGNSSQAPANSQLDLLDISLPGSLPKLNGSALRAAMLTSLGLNCTIQELIHFDRKNYFYPDMPSGFQVTQYNNPLAKNGYIEFVVNTYHRSLIAHSQQYDLNKCLHSEDRKSLEEFEPYLKRSHINRIQLEQDSAKTLHQTSSYHDQEVTSHLIDYNRSGAALIEIVFEPDLKNHQEASSLIKELVSILKVLGTCDCKLQESSLRVDANVSIDSLDNQNLNNSSRVELKNLNSLKALNYGISCEIQRQSSLIRQGQQVIQETRIYDSKAKQTVPLRIKEEAVDYRYIPEPSIPPLRLQQNLVDDVKKALPKKLPSEVRQKLMKKYDMDLILVAGVTEEPGLSDYMDLVLEGRPNYNPASIADFLIYTVYNLRRISASPVKVNFENSEFLLRIHPDKVKTLIDMASQEEISYAAAYEVIKLMFTGEIGTSEPKEIVSKLGWYQINDGTKIEELCADCARRMKNVSRKYAQRGDKKFLHMMLRDLCSRNENKINVKKAIQCFNMQLKPSTKSEESL